MKQILDFVKYEDNEFIDDLYNNLYKNNLDESLVSSVLQINRSIVYWSRQVVFAIKDLYLSEEELNEFEEMV